MNKPSKSGYYWAHQYNSTTKEYITYESTPVWFNVERNDVYVIGYDVPCSPDEFEWLAPCMYFNPDELETIEQAIRHSKSNSSNPEYHTDLLAIADKIKQVM